MKNKNDAVKIELILRYAIQINEFAYIAEANNEVEDEKLYKTAMKEIVSQILYKAKKAKIILF
jgi:hypothetical protein